MIETIPPVVAQLWTHRSMEAIGKFMTPIAWL
jgi:hypothetical protein